MAGPLFPDRRSQLEDHAFQRLLSSSLKACSDLSNCLSFAKAFEFYRISMIFVDNFNSLALDNYDGLLETRTFGFFLDSFSGLIILMRDLA